MGFQLRNGDFKDEILDRDLAKVTGPSSGQFS